MQLLEKLDRLIESSETVTPEKVLSHRLGDELKKLALFDSKQEMQKTSLYAALKGEIDAATFSYEYGCYAEADSKSSKPFCRAVQWHLQNGTHFKGVLETLRNRTLVSQADVYFFPATDIGMARSENRNLIRDLAIELGYNYFFSTTYLNLPGKNPDAEPDRLGIEGNAIMTRLPLSNLRVIPIQNERDGYSYGVRRLGCEKAVVADLNFNGTIFTVVCLNIPEWSSTRSRARYLGQVLDKLAVDCPGKPVLIAGDFKTSNYDCSSPFRFALSLFNKFYRDYDYIIDEHHTHPELHFDRSVFNRLKSHGFEFESFNEMGKGTYHVRPDMIFSSARKPQWVDKLIQKMLAKYQEELVFKYDWFSANQRIKPSASHQAERPKVIEHLFVDGKAASKHDPIMLDFEIV